MQGQVLKMWHSQREDWSCIQLKLHLLLSVTMYERHCSLRRNPGNLAVRGKPAELKASRQFFPRVTTQAYLQCPQKALSYSPLHNPRLQTTPLKQSQLVGCLTAPSDMHPDRFWSKKSAVSPLETGQHGTLQLSLYWWSSINGIFHSLLFIPYSVCLHLSQTSLNRCKASYAVK